MIKLDHIVIGAQTLEQGVNYVTQRLGSEPYGGGRHLQQGTHNKVLRLGDEVYLEVIAPDPASEITPPWFGLAHKTRQSSLDWLCGADRRTRKLTKADKVSA
jgi:hypothetical protein